MARRFTQPFVYDFIGRSNRALWCAAETPKNQDTAQSFQRTLQVGHCLIASGPADLSVGFCTIAIVTPGSSLVASVRRSRTKVRRTATFTCTAVLLRRMPESIATPCSVNTRGRLLVCLYSRFLLAEMD